MKVTLIHPRWGRRGLQYASFFRLPPLGLFQLASLTPKSWEVKIVDENIQPIDYNEPTDLVGISAMTPLASRAYEIARVYRSRGVPVIIGGIHASMCPEEALRYTDSVVIGEADMIWEQVLADFSSRQLERVYLVENRPDLAMLRITRRITPYKTFLGQRAPIIQTSRGCPFGCDFCAVSLFNGRKIRHRPISEVIQDIKRALPNGGYLIFADDNIVADKDYAVELFKALAGLGVRWVSQTDVRIATDSQLLRYALKSGVIAVFIGFEALDKQSLQREVCKAKAVWSSEYEGAITILRESRVIVHGSFVFGMDSHGKGVFETTVDWARRQSIDIAQFTIATPFPGTRLFERLEYAERITAVDRAECKYNWERFDAFHVVFEPAQMSAGELRHGFRFAYREFYSPLSMAKRLIPNAFGRGPLPTLAVATVNYQFRRFGR